MTLTAFDSHTIFCEIARNEEGGKVSLLGVLPDNLVMQGPPAPRVQEGQKAVPVLEHFCLSVRSRIPIRGPIDGGLSIRFISPTGNVLFDHAVDLEYLSEQFAVAKAANKACLTVVAQFALDRFQIRDEGRFEVWANYDGNDYFSGAITIELSDGMRGTEKEVD